MIKSKYNRISLFRLPSISNISLCRTKYLVPRMHFQANFLSPSRTFEIITIIKPGGIPVRLELEINLIMICLVLLILFLLVEIFSNPMYFKLFRIFLWLYAFLTFIIFFTAKWYTVESLYLELLYLEYLSMSNQISGP